MIQLIEGLLFRGKNARTRAYNYMRTRSLKTKYELSAAYLENGEVLVFKEKGNDFKTSHNYFIKKDGGIYADVNGHLVRVTGLVHTHPFVHGNLTPDNPLSLSGSDFKLASDFAQTIDIIVIKSSNGVGSGVYRVSTSGNGLVYPQLIFNF